MSNKNTGTIWDKAWKENRWAYLPVHILRRVFTGTPENSSVLEIGCGDGTLLSRLKNRKNCQVYGIDISPFALEECKRKGVPAIMKDVENLDDVIGEFDVIIAIHLFEHIDNDEGLARNVGRLAKKCAWICVPNNCEYPIKSGLHVRKYDIDSLTELLKPYFKGFENHTMRQHLMLKCLK